MLTAPQPTTPLLAALGLSGHSGWRERLRSSLCGVAVFCALAAGTASAVRAQTDYYNTDRYRPLRIEDPYPTERYSFDFHIAPIRVERLRGGTYVWEADPEIAYGILARTQLELGVPLSYTDLPSTGTSAGLGGLELSLLHNFNVETTRLPALGFRATMLFPVGSLAPDAFYPSLQGIVTRNFRWARFHVNAEYTAGHERDVGEHAELSRWLAGAAVDKAFPLRALLVGGEVYAEQPIHGGQAVWNAGVGVRYQLDPLFAVDGGVARRLSGEEQSWSITFGLARVLGSRKLIPGF